MRVGLTYDLRADYLAAGYGEEETAEFDKPETIEGISSALETLGYTPCPIGNVRALAAQLVTGERWDIVFNIAEGLRGRSRESQVPALLEAFDVPYTFSDPVVLGISLDKALAKRVLRDAGVPTPPFAVVDAPEAIAAVDLAPPLFAKPVAEGTGKGINAASRIADRQQLDAVCRALLERYHQPVLVEAFLPGREVTVGVLGTGREAEALGAVEVLLGAQADGQAYSYENKEHYEGRVEYALIADASFDREARELAVAAWRALECRDGGRVDLRADAQGRLQVLEINPLAGLRPVHSDLPIVADRVGVSYVELIARIMRSALRRYGLTPPRRRD